MAHLGGDTGMWDEEDGFFYDVLRLPDGEAQRLKVRSMVGLAAPVRGHGFRRRAAGEVPRARRAAPAVPRRRGPSCAQRIHDPSKVGASRPPACLPFWTKPSSAACWPRCSTRTSFSAPIGIRSLSRYHADHPYVFHAGGQEYRVGYLPAESDTGMFGGNSNWRGPIWMPVNALIIRALLQYYSYYGDDFTVECPTGSGRQMNLYQVAEEIGTAAGEHLPEGQGWPASGLRRVRRSSRKIRTGAICLLFYEYFHGDNGAGLGASHQTGWTGHHRPDHAPVRGRTSAGAGASGRWPARPFVETGRPDETSGLARRAGDSRRMIGSPK